MGFIARILNKLKKTPEIVDEDALESTTVSTNEEMIVVVLQDDGETYLFGPFYTEQEADEWEAGTRVAAKKMFAGDISISSGRVGILPMKSKDAQKYMSKIPIISPDHPEWQVLL